MTYSIVDGSRLYKIGLTEPNHEDWQHQQFRELRLNSLFATGVT
jgi:hypothetical protein